MVKKEKSWEGKLSTKHWMFVQRVQTCLEMQTGLTRDMNGKEIRWQVCLGYIVKMNKINKHWYPKFFIKMLTRESERIYRKNIWQIQNFFPYC